MSSEPTFTIKIQACEFRKLNQEQLTAKLQLMHKLNFKHHYTIVEDTNEPIIPPAPAEVPKVV